MILEHITDKIHWYSSIGLIKCTYNCSFGGNKRLLLDLREISQIIYNLQRGSCGITSITFSEALNGNSSVFKSLFSTESNNYMAELRPRPTVKAENIAYRQWSGLLWSTGFYVYCHHYQFFSTVSPLFFYHANFWAVVLFWFQSLNILEVLFIVLCNKIIISALVPLFEPPRGSIVTRHSVTTHIAKEPPKEKILSYMAWGGKWKQYLKDFFRWLWIFCVDLKHCKI